MSHPDLVRAKITEIFKKLPKQLVDNYVRLSELDTLHDFWDPRGDASPMKNDEASLNRVRDDIKEAVAATSGETEITDITYNINPSDTAYERKVIDKFEQLIPSYLYSLSKEAITYRDILNDPEAMKAKYVGSFGLCNVLEINNAPGEHFGSFSQSERNTIGGFVLSYMLGKPSAEVGQTQVGITFDAGPVVVRKALSGLEQVTNYIFPQNIADSAATDFKSFKRTIYQFPPDNIVKSNTFTNLDIEISYKNNGYSALNPYGFSINFKKLTPPIVDDVQLNFSPRQKDGASVNYLVSSLLNTIERAQREKSTIIDLNPLTKIATDKNLAKRLILDLKRTGDYEQVNAATQDTRVVFATIDLLCSFYARMRQKSCLWSCNGTEELVLYRFQTTPPTEKQNFMLTYIFFAQEQLRRVKLIQSLGGISDDLLKVFNECTMGAKNGLYVTQSKNRDAVYNYIEKSPKTDLKDPTNRGIFADAITTLMLSAQMDDIAAYVNRLRENLLAVRSDPKYAEIVSQWPAVQEALGILSQTATTSDNYPPGFSVAAVQPSNQLHFFYKSVDITETIEALKKYLEGVKELIEFEMNGDVVYRPLFKGDVFDNGSSNSVIHFSGGIYKLFNQKFREFVGLVYVQREGGRGDAQLKVDNSLAEFFGHRDRILESFFNSEFAETIRGQFDIASGTLLPAYPDAIIKMRDTLFTAANEDEELGGGAKVGMDSIAKKRPPTDAPYVRPVPRLASVFSVAQYLDSSDLFRDICGLATRHVNASFSEAGIEDVRALNVEATISVVNDICYIWETGMMDIRDNAEAVYGVQYEANITDKFITMFVSASTMPNNTTDFKSYFGGEIERRSLPIVNELVSTMVVNALLPAEFRVVLILAIFDAIMSEPSLPKSEFARQYTRGTQKEYNAKAKWGSLPTDMMVYIRTLSGLTPQPPSPEALRLQTGGRRGLYSTNP